MLKTQDRTYARYTHQAVALLGQMIRLYRKERRLTAQELAGRAGISRTTLQKIERGDMKCEIGLVFEAATLVGIPLFEEQPASLKTIDRRIEDKLSLLPKSIRSSHKKVDDDF